jgi:hypothetical protein
MESWQFIQSPAGEWYWVCSNVISRQTRTSAATFQTRMECVANAMASGYQKLVAGGGFQGQVKAATPPRATKHPRSPPNTAQPAAKRAQRRNRNKSGKRSKSS